MRKLYFSKPCPKLRYWHIQYSDYVTYDSENVRSDSILT